MWPCKKKEERSRQKEQTVQRLLHPPHPPTLPRPDLGHLDGTAWRQGPLHVSAPQTAWFSSAPQMRTPWGSERLCHAREFTQHKHEPGTVGTGGSCLRREEPPTEDGSLDRQRLGQGGQSDTGLGQQGTERQ